MISVPWITDVLAIFPPRILLWTEAKEQSCFASCTQLAFLSIPSQWSVICSPFAHFTRSIHARYWSSASDEKTWPPGLDVLWGDRNNELKMWCGRNKQVWWKSYEWGANKSRGGAGYTACGLRQCILHLHKLSRSQCFLRLGVYVPFRVWRTGLFKSFFFFHYSACSTKSFFHCIVIITMSLQVSSYYFITWFEVIRE